MMVYYGACVILVVDFFSMAGPFGTDHIIPCFARPVISVDLFGFTCVFVAINYYFVCSVLEYVGHISRSE